MSVRVLVIEVPDGHDGPLAEVIARALERSREPERRVKPYSVAEAAELLGVSRVTVYERMAAGAIRQVPNVGRKLIPAAEMERLLEGGEQ